ncbi:MAG: copper chaperone PCu(A)C [Ignavibacteriales bacterium]|nr:copper chaperone PCu(A)C [Ignavibacteriales bacterium]
MLNLIIGILLLATLAPKLEVTNNWVRPSSKDMNTAVYAVIKNNSDKADTLYSVSSNLAKVTEIHETYEKDGSMGMRKVDFIVIPAKKSFELKPGSHHIMLIKLNQDIQKGKKYELTYKFKRAGEIKVSAVANDKASGHGTH